MIEYQQVEIYFYHLRVIMATKVENEIKYRIADSSFVQDLLAAKRLGSCDIAEFQTRQHHDIYFDTPDRAFMAAGYAFRYRRTATRGIVQLKSLNKSSEHVYRRTELWAETDRPAAPRTWAPGLARDLALDILHNRTLQPLFEIRQIRRFANLMYDGVVVSELSIDEVLWLVDARESRDWELEIELSDACSDELMHLIDDELLQTGKLAYQNQSKFERGLALLETTD